MGFLARLQRGLSRTTQQFVRRFDEIVRRSDSASATQAQLDGDTVDALEELLISADVGVEATGQILNAVRAQSPHGARLRDLVKQEIQSILERAGDGGAAEGGGTVSTGPAREPRVALVVGVNGTGKTTTVGKLARLYVTQGQRPLVCAADTFRAAAVEQLAAWAARAGVDIVRAREGADPAAVVYDAIAAARARSATLVLVDTAGRLHTRANLMHELEKIRRVAAREVPGAPHDVLLVLDATVGQNGLAQAREFMGRAGVNGIVLAKLDGTAKGGIAVAIAHDLKLPIRYVGVGETIDDLLPFSARDYVDALLEPQSLRGD
jgi:fused signal recognition particle receptor